MGQRFVITCIAGLIGILLGIGSAAADASKEPESNELLPVTVKLDELTNVLTSKDAIIVDMVFVIANPNPDWVRMKQLEWTVRVEKTRLGTLAVPEAVWLPPKGEARVRKTYFLNAKTGPVNLLLAGAAINLEQGGKIFADIAKAITDEKASWNLEGRAYLDSQKGTKSVPFSIELNQPPGN